MKAKPKLEQANPVSALIYASNAPLDFRSTGDFFGATVVKTVTFESSGGLHYDRSLPWRFLRNLQRFMTTRLGQCLVNEITAEVGTSLQVSRFD
jgi:hypothetical protein